MSEDPTYHSRTRAVHHGIRRSQHGELSEALHLTQGFVYPSAEAAEARFEAPTREGFIYARYGNPTVAMFEDRIANLEGTEDAFATASGMAAVNGLLMSCLRAGDHVVAARALFGSCLYLLEEVLPRFGVEVTFVDGRDLSAWEGALREGTKLAFFESVSNPTLEMIDVASVSALARKVGALSVVDNVFATPVLAPAAPLGADVVIYSTTKHIDGQGRCLGGVICGSREFVRGTVEPFMKHSGGALSPFNAWVMLKSLDHLHLRVEAQTRSALALAELAEGHGACAAVLYPMLKSHPDFALAERQMGQGGGTVLALDLGDKARAFDFLNALRVFTLSNNLGDAKSIATHPATTTHQALPSETKQTLGITEGLVRLSVGLEDLRDLAADVKGALDAL